MDYRKQLFGYFGIAGFLGALGGTVFLWQFYGLENSNILFGVRQSWPFFVLPFVGALVAGFWAALFRGPSFGPARGALVAVLSFLTFTALLSAVRMESAMDSMARFFAYSFFGFIFVGWALVAIGVLTGWLFKRQVGLALSNPPLNRTRADNARAG